MYMYILCNITYNLYNIIAIVNFYSNIFSVTNPSTMPSLTPLLCRHYPLYYDVTNPSTMTSLTPLR